MEDVEDGHLSYLVDEVFLVDEGPFRCGWKRKQRDLIECGDGDAAAFQNNIIKTGKQESKRRPASTRSGGPTKTKRTTPATNTNVEVEEDEAV